MLYKYPKTYARFYDLIYHQIRDSVDKEFFLNEIKKVRKKVLEIGVGTGRFFTTSLSRGADIYGLDISQSMIDVLLDKLEPQYHKRISKQNIVDFHYDHKFELIVAPFRVFMHLLDKKEQLAALDNVHRHLLPKGRFIFDTFVPNLQQLIKGFDHHVDFEAEYETGKKLKRIVSTCPDLINQLINITFHLEWDEDDGPKQEEWKFPLRFFFRYELEHLVERSAFRKYRILGDYSGNALQADSQEFIVICTK